MNPLFIVLVVILAVLAGSACLTTNRKWRSVLIVTLPLATFTFCRLHDTAMARFQEKQENTLHGDKACQEMRSSDQTAAHERLNMDVLLMFSGSIALAIIAVIPKKRSSTAQSAERV